LGRTAVRSAWWAVSTRGRGNGGVWHKTTIIFPHLGYT